MTISTGYIINQRYRIVKTITTGGFGRLYRAWDLSLKRPVALKQNLEDSEIGRNQFETEALILADLHHPNLARVTDYFITPEEGQFLVMDFIEGEDLQSMIDRSGPLTEERAIIWINQVCDALVYIHCQNPPIIHRDIKPANIRIMPTGKAILVDFGIAKTYSPDKVTVTGARAVTPGYAPVEQYGSARTDARSDIYAIGATLYALLTGREPPESIYLVSGTQLPRLRQINVQISSSTEEVVHTAMALNPSDRYQSINAFQAVLKIQDQPEVIHRNLWLPKIVIILFAVLIFIDLAAIFSSFMQINIISKIIQGEVLPTGDILNSDRLQQTISLVQGLSWALALLGFLVWIYVTSKYFTETTRGFRYSPLWAVVGCLIPIYNLVHPYQVLNALWESSIPKLPNNTGQQQSKGSSMILGWWILSVAAIASILITVIFRNGTLSLNQIRISGYLFILSYLINASAAALSLILVNKITHSQESSDESYGDIKRTIQVG